MALGTIISLLTLLANLGVQAGKAGARKKEEKKVGSRELEMQVEQKKLQEEAQAKARRDAISRAIGAKNVTIPTFDEPKIEPYTPKDLSGYDTARGVIGDVGNLVSSSVNYKNKEPDLDGSKEAAKAFPGGGVDAVTPSSESNTGMAKVNEGIQPNNPYMAYYTRKYNRGNG